MILDGRGGWLKRHCGRLKAGASGWAGRDRNPEVAAQSLSPQKFRFRAGRCRSVRIKTPRSGAPGQNLENDPMQRYNAQAFQWDRRAHAVHVPRRTPLLAPDMRLLYFNELDPSRPRGGLTPRTESALPDPWRPRSGARGRRAAPPVAPNGRSRCRRWRRRRSVWRAGCIPTRPS